MLMTGLITIVMIPLMYKLASFEHLKDLPGYSDS